MTERTPYIANNNKQNERIQNKINVNDNAAPSTAVDASRARREKQTEIQRWHPKTNPKI
jgi:hypothetical protein